MRYCNLLFLLFCTAASSCTLTPTSCSCSYRQGSGLCYQKVSSKPGVCSLTVCVERWSCDCGNPTHMCTRLTCQEYESVPFSPQPSSILTADEISCPERLLKRCVKTTGQPLRPIGVITNSASPSPIPSPSSSASPSPSQTATVGIACKNSDECGVHADCIQGKCYLLGSCGAELDAYCASTGADMKCCHMNTICARDYFNEDTSVCADECGEYCLEQGNKVQCVLKNGGSDVGFFPQGEAVYVTFGYQACPGVL